MFAYQINRLSCISPQHNLPIFFIFPPDFQQRNEDTRSCVFYKVYGVDKLSSNKNVHKKKSTRPKSTLYLARVENVIAHIL